MSRYLVFVPLLVAWEAAARLSLLSTAIFSSPTGLAIAAIDWYGSGKIAPQLGWTLLEIAVGWTLSFVVALPIGLLIGRYRWFADFSNPLFYFLDAVPVVAIAPVLPLIFGFGPWTAISLVFLLTVLPTTFSISAGVRTVPPDLLRMGRHFGAHDRQLFGSIVLPFIVPYILGAQRGNIARALAGALVGEWMGSNVGLGSMMFDAAGVFESKTVYVGAMTVVILSLVASALLGIADRRLGRWTAVAR